MSEHLYSIALTQLKGVSTSNAKVLYEAFGSAKAIYENRNDIRSIIPDATPRMVGAMQSWDDALKRAEAELEFIGSKKMRVLCLNDDDYPQRLKECDDAPVVLFYCGNADLNKAKVVSMVGTRKCSEYGKDLCRNFVADLKRYYPDVLIVSGLAYGIDIHSHRAALANGMDTVGVLAHGLDRVYPAVHRQTAVEMVSHGGLLTEYISGTTPERGNFLSRNRIIAGMCDACIIVESASHGGSLVTAGIAQAYSRDVLTFPGRVCDEQSEGCNRLIRDNKAALIQNAEDFINAVCWKNTLAEDSGRSMQRELFVELTDEEQLIVNCLQGFDDKPISMIVNETGLSFSRMSVLMFELELKNIVKALGGARYRLTMKKF